MSDGVLFRRFSIPTNSLDLCFVPSLFNPHQVTRLIAWRVALKRQTGWKRVELE
jgi:hypothetical protein